MALLKQVYWKLDAIYTYLKGPKYKIGKVTPYYDSTITNIRYDWKFGTYIYDFNGKEFGASEALIDFYEKKEVNGK